MPQNILSVRYYNSKAGLLFSGSLTYGNSVIFVIGNTRCSLNGSKLIRFILAPWIVTHLNQTLRLSLLASPSSRSPVFSFLSVEDSHSCLNHWTAAKWQNRFYLQKANDPCCQPLLWATFPTLPHFIGKWNNYWTKQCHSSCSWSSACGWLGNPLNECQVWQCGAQTHAWHLNLFCQQD